MKARGSLEEFLGRIRANDSRRTSGTFETDPILFGRARADRDAADHPVRDELRPHAMSTVVRVIEHGERHPPERKADHVAHFEDRPINEVEEHRWESLFRVWASIPYEASELL
jgi:hypothetical protein